ncbi:MAG: signal peptidase I [Phycisphaerae bacterium]|nr:signal peptidase I [Saprospiraceae bacterium]
MVKNRELAGLIMKQSFFKQYLPIALALIFAVFMTARTIGMIGLTSIPTESMMPNYAANSTIFTYNWATPSRNDVVTYYDTSIAVPNIRFAKRELSLGRIIAFGGERLEISQGRVLINGEDSDHASNLLYFWEISKNDFSANQPRFNALPIPPVDFLDSVLVAMEVPKAMDIQRFVPMHLFDIRIFGKGTDNIWGNSGANWTMNNFGPITIPKGCLFILGDNRHNTEDSRYRGFVAENDIVGKVLN